MEQSLTDEQISGKVLDHLGLVAATIAHLGLLKKIDDKLPLSKAHGAKTTIGQRISAMIMNGLGFIDDRLYMFPEFLRNKPVERLLGEGLSADDFNDDALGRALDKVHEYGVTRLFSELAFDIGVEQKLLGKTAHFDTTTLGVFGSFDSDLEVSEEIASQLDIAEPAYGFSKSHRSDLKQMVLNLATTGSSAFPIWMQAHSGNASDKKVLYEAAKRMKDFCSKLKETPSFLYVADSAMYESCIKEAGDLLWLSRVPASHKEAKRLLQLPDSEFNFKELPDGYRICVIKNKYRDIPQRWCIVSSQQAFEREIITLEKNVTKDLFLAKDILRIAAKKPYACAKDAKSASLKLSEKLKYHTLSITIEKRYKKATKTKKAVTSYRITGEVKPDEEKIESCRREKGRFILATNQLDSKELPDEEILPLYKEQSSTEGGFKFIKDDTFEVDSIFLKKPERITALMMIMTLCLMVYSFSQQFFRKALQENKDTIPDQCKKPTDKPTMKWVYRLFNGVQVINILLNDFSQEIVINLNEVTKKIVRYFGPAAMNIYSVAPI